MPPCGAGHDDRGPCRVARQGTLTIRRFSAREAFQAVAVDKEHFYAIGNAAIGKYRRADGVRIARWAADEEHPLTHLNSGVVLGNKLFCAHSNYPKDPATSSVEIWDTKTLEHVGVHSFGITTGSLTWVDRKDGHWWAVFAHYSKTAGGRGAGDHRRTALVQFDGTWRRRQSFVFPESVLERMAPNSCSGGAWGPDGDLYCTGHDRGELYQLQLPKAGSTLTLVRTHRVPLAGQGFAWDRHHPGQLLGIRRATREVLVVRLHRGR